MDIDVSPTYGEMQVSPKGKYAAVAIEKVQGYDLAYLMVDTGEEVARLERILRDNGWGRLHSVHPIDEAIEARRY